MKFLMMTGSTLCAALLFGGCDTLTPEQIQQNRVYYAEQERAARHEYLSGLRSKCEQYGYQAGTAELSRCMEGADAMEQVKKANDDAERNKRDRAFWCGQGVQWSCDSQPPQPQVSTCKLNLMGNLVCVTQ